MCGKSVYGATHTDEHTNFTQRGLKSVPCDRESVALRSVHVDTHM